MIVIGKLKEIYHDESLPSIFELLSNKPVRQKDDIVKYMRKGKITSCSPAIVRDIITNQVINIPLNFMTDGVYAWRSDTIYYFEKYDIKLDNDFIEYVLNKVSQTKDLILCPLTNTFITPVDCMENRDIKEDFIPDKFKQLSDWKKICENCVYSDL